MRATLLVTLKVINLLLQALFAILGTAFLLVFLLLSCITFLVFPVIIIAIWSIDAFGPIVLVVAPITFAVLFMISVIGYIGFFSISSWFSKRTFRFFKFESEELINSLGPAY
jgi:hypothetical protein